MGNQIKAGSTPQTKATYKSVLDRALNDPKFVLYVKNTHTGKDETICPYELYWSAFKKNLADMGYPNKNEIDDAIAEAKAGKAALEDLGRFCPAVPLMVMMEGETFEFPRLENLRGSVYIKAIPEGEKVHPNRDIKTGEVNGTVTSHWKPHFKIVAKSKTPADLVTKTKNT
jgi:hypothetical protein